jgi:hypothetical protein
VIVQVARVGRGSVIQTQTFDDLRNLEASRAELTEEDRRLIREVLTDLERATKESGLREKIEQARERFTKYEWLLEPLLMVLKTILRLT